MGKSEITVRLESGNDPVNVTYEFIVQGDLDIHWSQWFGGLAVTHNAQGETVICGPIKDQAELYGVINRFRDLGLVLVSIRRIDQDKQTGV